MKKSKSTYYNFFLLDDCTTDISLLTTPLQVKKEMKILIKLCKGKSGVLKEFEQYYKITNCAPQFKRFIKRFRKNLKDTL